MANNTPPGYYDNFFTQFFVFTPGTPSQSSASARPSVSSRTPSTAPSVSPSVTPSMASGLRPTASLFSADVFEERPHKPRRPSAQSAPELRLQKKTGSGAAKYAWKALTGGKHRQMAKERLFSVQEDIVMRNQDMVSLSRVYSSKAAAYNQVVEQYVRVRDAAYGVLVQRQQVIQNMWTVYSYDPSLEADFLTLDLLYREELYPELMELLALLHDQGASIRATVEGMAQVRNSAMASVNNFGSLQTAFIRRYARLPHGISPAATFRGIFDIPDAPGNIDPLPAPSELDDMPEHFRPTAAPPPRGNRGPQPQANAGPRAGARPQPEPQPQAIYGRIDAPVALGTAAIGRTAIALEKVFAGDASAWAQVQSRDLDAIEQALRRSRLRYESSDSPTARARRQVALKVLGDPEIAQARLRYRKRQMVVHPDKTGNLPPDARSKADALCKILTAALDELTHT